MNTLPVDYVDAVISGGGSRKYTMTTNSDSTVSFTDATTYTTEGSQFGATDINATNAAINKLARVVTMEINQYAWTQSGSVWYRDWITTNFTTSDTPIVSLYIPWSTPRETAKVMQKNYSYINDVTIGYDSDNSRFFIRVIVNARPTSAFQIMLKGA